MKRAFLIIIIIGISFAKSYGCLNGETKELKDGTIVFSDREGAIIPYGHDYMLEDNLSEKLGELDSLWKVTNDIDYLSDYGVILIFKKEYEKAKDLYLKIESIKPNRYSTASNLGTVYELLGKNGNALKWIKKSVEIDPAAHKGSEWLHVKILEAKIKGEQFITADFLINTNFGTDVKPKSNLSSQELLKLRNALYFQLNERISFIKSNDKIIARLLFDLGNITYLTGATAEAVVIYKAAKDYGFLEPILNLRYDNAVNEKKAEKPNIKTVTKTSNYFLLSLIGVSIVLIVSLLLFKKRHRTNGS